MTDTPTTQPTLEPSFFIQEESSSVENDSMNNIWWPVIGVLSGLGFCTCIGVRYYYSRQESMMTMMANAEFVGATDRVINVMVTEEEID